MKKVLWGTLWLFLILGCDPVEKPVEGESIPMAWATADFYLLNYAESNIDVTLTYKDMSTSQLSIAPTDTLSMEQFKTTNNQESLEYLFDFIIDPSDNTLPFSKETATKVVSGAFAFSQENAYVTQLSVAQDGIILYEATIDLNTAGRKFYQQPLLGVDPSIYDVLPINRDQLDPVYIIWDTSEGRALQAHLSCYIGIFP